MLVPAVRDTIYLGRAPGRRREAEWPRELTRIGCHQHRPGPPGQSWTLVKCQKQYMPRVRRSELRAARAARAARQGNGNIFAVDDTSICEIRESQIQSPTRSGNTQQNRNHPECREKVAKETLRRWRPWEILTSIIHGNPRAMAPIGHGNPYLDQPWKSEGDGAHGKSLS